jgi:hypothetical protein
VIELMAGLLMAAAFLVVLRFGAELCWRAFDSIATVVFDRFQQELMQRRVELRHRLLQQAIREEERRAGERSSSRRIVDLDGQQCIVTQGNLPSFLRLCMLELELDVNPSTLDWQQVRRHWRQRSLTWHPDRGGHVQNWLRKQRAYEAIENLLPLWQEQLDRLPVRE